MEALELARLQFAVTAGFHFFFVVLTLGLAPAVAIMETRYVISGKKVFRDMTRFWGQIYVINYALGILTGLIMEFQFGFAWSGVSKFVGNVFGAPLAMETLVAFFLESTFLAMWIFGWHVFGRKTHCLLIWLVTATAYMSAFWIMVANSFMQDPQGYEVRDGVGHLTDFNALITHEGLWYALPHIVGAAGLVTGFLMIAFSAYAFLRDRELRRSAGLRRRAAMPDDVREDRTFHLSSMRMGVLFAALGSGLNFHYSHVKLYYLEEAQPLKYGQWADRGPEDLAFTQEQMVELYGPGDYEASSLASGAAVLMEELGMLFLLVAVFVLPFLLLFNLLARWRPLLVLTLLLPPLPFVATMSGWIYREMGRQPYVVYGELTTADAVSPVGTSLLAVSLTAFTVLVLTLTVINWSLILRTVRRGWRSVRLGAETQDPDAEVGPGSGSGADPGPDDLSTPVRL